MIKESLGEEENVSNDMGFKSMLLLAIATSIDALAVGVSLAFLKVAILPAVLFIGCITFVCSAAGVKIGSIFGDKYQSKAELCGGIILQQPPYLLSFLQRTPCRYHGVECRMPGGLRSYLWCNEAVAVGLAQ